MAQIFPPYVNTLCKLSIYGAVGVPVVLFFYGSQLTRSSLNTDVNNSIEQPVPFSHQHHSFELGIDCRYCHTSVEKGPFAGVPPTHTCMSCHSQIWTNSPLLEPIRNSLRTNTPVAWQRVNKLPDFVYFNHSIHITRGINCNVCHGALNKMNLTTKGKTFFMSWCLACHREPEKHLYVDAENPGLTPAQQVFNLYTKAERAQALSPRENAIINGTGDSYSPSPEELAQGKELLKKWKVDKAQLMDCWTCHR